MHCSRAIVTGADGFIGRHMVQCLRGVGIEVLGLDRSVSRRDEHTVDECVDLSKSGVLDQYVDAGSVVFHLAGAANVRGSITDPINDFNSNATLTLNVLESVRRSGARMLLPSSGSVYDATSDTPYPETTALCPSSPYGAAKIAAEAYCQAYRRSYGIDVRVARIFSVYGPGIRRLAIYDFYQRLRENPAQLTLRGDGGQTRDYMYVGDVARALVLIASRGVAGGTYNVASGKARTMREVAAAVASAAGFSDCTITVDGVPQSGELYRMEADTSRLTDLGFRPRFTFEQGLARTVSWLREEEAFLSSDPCPGVQA